LQRGLSVFSGRKKIARQIFAARAWTIPVSTVQRP
jgi:hypothetical protein